MQEDNSIKTAGQAALFKIAPKWKHCQFPSTDKCINEVWSIYTTEYYLAIKRNDEFTHAITRMDYENFMMGERSPTQRATYCMFSPI